MGKSWKKIMQSITLSINRRYKKGEKDESLKKRKGKGKKTHISLKNVYILYINYKYIMIKKININNC